MLYKALNQGTFSKRHSHNKSQPNKICYVGACLLPLGRYALQQSAQSQSWANGGEISGGSYGYICTYFFTILESVNCIGWHAACTLLALPLRPLRDRVGLFANESLRCSLLAAVIGHWIVTCFGGQPAIGTWYQLVGCLARSIYGKSI